MSDADFIRKSTKSPADVWDQEFAERRARMDRTRRASLIIGLLLSFLSAGAVVWCLTHPRLIGAFFGSIVAGFNAGAR